MILDAVEGLKRLYRKKEVEASITTKRKYEKTISFDLYKGIKCKNYSPLNVYLIH